MKNFDFVRAAHECYESRVVDERLSPNDTMKNEWYLEVGRSAVDVILAACLSSRISRVQRVLDLPCGHGRVLRHLVQLFPEAQFDACDLDADGVKYCAETFGARPILSRPDLSEVDFGAQYDLIWVGSLFTHVSQKFAQRWLAHLARYLAPDGIVVATLHGRWSEHVHAKYPYIAAGRWKTILDGYRRDGYGYCDYAKEEVPGFLGGAYGVSLVSPRVSIGMIEQIPGVRIYSYGERAWADHQDVVVFGKPAFDKAWGT
jgi:SAM-dependent methyltransferase